MCRAVGRLLVLFVLAEVSLAGGAEQADVKALLSRKILGPQETLEAVQRYCEARVPPMPQVETAAQWEAEAERLRAEMLEKIVFRGTPNSWRTAKTRVEWLDTIPGGPGYRIKKFRYEALPGMWIPALLYEPDRLSGKVPAVLNLHGHFPGGKVRPSAQVRLINQAKRGMIAMSPEWLGMGQLRTDDFYHYRASQLNLCGASGVAPFYLCMTRGLDALLSLEHADPERVAVTGLSGGGWQTIFLSALDRRVKLSTPVAGYSSVRTRAQHPKDLGDPEQSPTDMATVADYTHLTAMVAPRPMLLVYNLKDDCCFQSGYALPPLLEAALPIYRLFGKEYALRWHVNEVPGTHNYDQDNREAFYRMIGDFFFAGSAKYSACEIPSTNEVKSPAELSVPMPAENENFHSLAVTLAKHLPRQPDLPSNVAAALAWQEQGRQRLRQLVRAKDYSVKAQKAGGEEECGLRATFWKLRIGDTWTLPVTELAEGDPAKTAIVVADAGRAEAAADVARLLGLGYRVLAADLLYFGESQFTIERKQELALLLETVGGRLLGQQAGELAAMARWAQADRNSDSVTLVAFGPRVGIAALVAAAMEPKAIHEAELHDALGSLKEIIERNAELSEEPELFCFGLLEAFDVKQLVALVAPRPVLFVHPSDRVKVEMTGLAEWYGILGSRFDPMR